MLAVEGELKPLPVTLEIYADHVNPIIVLVITQLAFERLYHLLRHRPTRNEFHLPGNAERALRALRD